LVQGIRFDKQTGARIRTLPGLLVKLRGEVAINVRAKTGVRGGRLVTTFGSVPDVPISRFSLRIASGKRSIVSTTERLCGSNLRISVSGRGQNGRAHRSTPMAKAPCAGRRR
jgi:hypothetical protein